LTEVRLADGHRADIMAIAPRGEILIVEIKVSAADLRGDRKWQAYRRFCDRFAWATPPGLSRLAREQCFEPEGCGQIVADRHEAVWHHEAPAFPLPPARRRAVLLAFARTGAARAMRAADPDFDGFGRW
jgi:hypothetical protein